MTVDTDIHIPTVPPPPPSLMKVRITLSIFLFLHLIAAAHGQAEVEAKKSYQPSLNSPVRLIDISPSGEFSLFIEIGERELSLADMELSLFLVSGGLLAPLESIMLPPDKDLASATNCRIKLSQLPERPVRVLAWLKGDSDGEAIDCKFWIHLFPNDQLAASRKGVPPCIQFEFSGEENMALKTLVHGLLPGHEEVSFDGQQGDMVHSACRIRFELDTNETLRISLIENRELGMDALDSSKQVLFQGRVDLFLRNPNIQAEFLQKLF